MCFKKITNTLEASTNPNPLHLLHPPTPRKKKKIFPLTREFDDVENLSCFLLNANILATGIVCDEII